MLADSVSMVTSRQTKQVVAHWEARCAKYVRIANGRSNLLAYLHKPTTSTVRAKATRWEVGGGSVCELELENLWEFNTWIL